MMLRGEHVAWHTCRGQFSPPTFTWVPGVGFREPRLHSKCKRPAESSHWPSNFIYLERGSHYVALPGPGPTEILCHWSATTKDVCHRVPGHLYLFIFPTTSLPEPATHLHGQASQWVSGICPSLSPSVGVTDLCCCARPCGGPGAPHTHEVGSLPAEPSPQAPQRPLLAC